MRNNNKKYQFTSSRPWKLISRPYHDQETGGFDLSWMDLILWFLQNSIQGIKKDLNWINLKSLETEIELPGRDSNLRPIG